jgi:asparagine synthase (glutamine-hydrolysing)
MCGICGVYGSSEPSLTTKMLDALLHRGPDGRKIEHYHWGSLGFCRLDIFGSAGVNQPVKTDDQKIALVFNGEIYNFDELCQLFPSKPIQDEAFLILELYLKFGEKAFSKLKGMFAIAIMTPDKLLLVRDTTGIKPLVYYTSGNNLYFASEIKAPTK